MSLRNWFAKLPVPRLMIQHGKPGVGQYAVVSTSSNGKLYLADTDDKLPFVIIKKS